MRLSILSGIFSYFGSVTSSIVSLTGSCMTVIPYLLRLGDNSKEITEGYPDPISSKIADDLPPRTRGFLFNNIDLCTGCEDCVRICPSRCIRVEAEQAGNSSKMWVSRFDIDFSKCVFCGLCVEVCHSESLVHTRQFEGAAYHLKELTEHFGRGQVTFEQREKWILLRKMVEDDEE